MIKLRPANERGHADFGWLDSRHTFSFGDYYDPEQMGFASLRVINDDHIAAGMGFGTHPHDNMEIITYVLEGAVAHKDSMGHTEILRAGELQRMTAGTGLTHSEFNASKTDPLHLYQIWILPERRGLEPSYEQRVFDPAGRKNRWQLVVAPAGHAPSNGDAPLTMHQDASLWLADLAPQTKLTRALQKNRAAWLQVLRGEVTLNGKQLREGDGAAISDETELATETGADAAELLLFDLA